MDELDPALAATIAAIPEWDGLEPEVTPITIGITNRNFRVDIGGAREKRQRRQRDVICCPPMKKRWRF